MKKIHCLNPIAKCGTELFPAGYEMTDKAADADAVLVRSASMHDMELPENLLAVGRAGAGVNNIPLDSCAQKGIVVFNTPGANANGVKELVIAGMLMASRDIVGGIEWCKANAEDDNITKIQRRARRHLLAARLRARSWELSAWAPSGRRLPTQPPIWEWRYTDTTRIFPSMRPGDCPGM